MSRIAWAVALLGCTWGNGAAQSGVTAPQLDSLAAALKPLGAVGAAVTVVAGPQVAWAGGYGLADRERGLPMTAETPVMLASASKLFTGAALLRAREELGFSLDDDVSARLPFVLRNPAFPDRPISYRMLLVHTSSIADHAVLRPLYGYGDSELSLGDLANGYFAPGGKWYGHSFHPYAPGEKYTYTNSSFSLLGYLVERLTGTEFESYCRRELFEPLGMRHTSWFLRGVDSSQVARHYVADSLPGALRPVWHYGWPGYPDGQLRASATDVGHFLAMLLAGGRYEGRQVLSPETVRLMLEPQHVTGLPSPFLPSVDLSLPWHINRLGEREIYLHTGRGSGISTAVWLDPAAGTGGALLLTGPVQDRDGFINLIRLVVSAGDWYAARREPT